MARCCLLVFPSPNTNHHVRSLGCGWFLLPTTASSNSRRRHLLVTWMVLVLVLPSQGFHVLGLTRFLDFPIKRLPASLLDVPHLFLYSQLERLERNFLA